MLEDFSIDPDSNGHYVQDICLTNRNTNKVFYEGLKYIFLELINFAKTEEQLETGLDKWLYVLKNMSRLDMIPLFLRKTIFEKVFSIAEYSNMTKEEKTMYNSALKRKWDNQNVLDYAIKAAKEEGIKEGIERGVERGIKEGIEKGVKKERAKADAEKHKSAQLLKLSGVPVKDIAHALGRSIKEVEQL